MSQGRVMILLGSQMGSLTKQWESSLLHVNSQCCQQAAGPASTISIGVASVYREIQECVIPSERLQCACCGNGRCTVQIWRSYCDMSSPTQSVLS